MIFLVYLLSFVAISVVDALWHFVLLGQQLQLFPWVISQLLFVVTTMFLVLYKTGGHPKLYQGALIGVACGILSVSVYGLVHYALLEVLWGPIIGVFAGILIAFFGGKFLK